MTGGNDDDDSLLNFSILQYTLVYFSILMLYYPLPMACVPPPSCMHAITRPPSPPLPSPPLPSHLHHLLRSYISFDILRRVLSGYFNYDVLYVMNVTDIDDKIIYGARKAHLLREYRQNEKSLQETVADVELALGVGVCVHVGGGGCSSGVC